MRLIIISYILVVCSQISYSQIDTTVTLDNNFEFKDGIYLNFEQVRHNSPITRSQIVTSLDKDDIDFYEKLIKQEYIRFIDRGMTKIIETRQIWGFCDEGTLYIHLGDDFAKIINKGHLGYFIAIHKVTYYDRPYYTTYYYDPNVVYPRTSQEMRHFIIDFSTGKIYDFNPQSLLKILKQYDPQLFQEYNNLSRRKQKKLIFYYLRKFNSRHPLTITIKKSDL